MLLRIHGADFLHQASFIPAAYKTIGRLTSSVGIPGPRLRHIYLQNSKVIFAEGQGGNPYNLNNYFPGWSELEECCYLLTLPVLTAAGSRAAFIAGEQVSQENTEL